jgi:hypothetical protein
MLPVLALESIGQEFLVAPDIGSMSILVVGLVPVNVLRLGLRFGENRRHVGMTLDAPLYRLEVEGGGDAYVWETSMSL